MLKGKTLVIVSASGLSLGIAKPRGIGNGAAICNRLPVALPTEKFVTVEQLAAPTCSLLGDAAVSIARAILPADGGWAARTRSGNLRGKRHHEQGRTLALARADRSDRGRG